MGNPITLTKKEWLEKGTALFGDDMMKWEFVCPGCGHVATVEDYKPFKNQGATPDSARNECIGRYTNGKSWANSKHLNGGPCDYAGYGLLRISPVVVIDDSGRECSSFAFNEARNLEKNK